MELAVEALPVEMEIKYGCEAVDDGCCGEWDGLRFTFVSYKSQRSDASSVCRRNVPMFHSYIVGR
jgi:hypothetical protein